MPGVFEFLKNNTYEARQNRKLESQYEPFRQVFLEQASGDPRLGQLQKLAQDPEAFSQIMSDPQKLQGVLQVAEIGAVTPEAKPEPGDDILALFDRGAQFAEAGDVRRAELMVSAAANKAGIDLNAGNTGPFGSGLKGNSFNLVNQLAPGAISGQLNDDQGRLLDTALATVMQPVPFQDPITRETLMIEPTLPPFIRQLAQQRGIAPGGPQGGAGTPAAAPPTAGQPVATPAPGGGPAPTEEPSENVFAALPSGTSIFDQAANLTGPVDAVLRKLSGVTGFGGLTDEKVGAERLAANVTELLVDAMRTEREGSSRAIQEVNDLRDKFGFTAETFGSQENLEERSAQARIELERRESEILERLSNAGRTSGEQKKRDLDALVRIQSVKDRIAPPVLQTAQEIQDFIANSESGTEYLRRDPTRPGAPFRKARVKARSE